MSYRFIRVTDYYDGFIRAFYPEHPEVSRLGYDEHYDRLTNESIEIVSSYGKAMRALGVHATDIISNAGELQRTWSKENGMTSDVSAEALVISQIKAARPDVVWIDTTSLLNVSWLNELRKAVPSIKVLAGHICAPYGSQHADAFKSLDIVFTCTPCMREELLRSGVKKSVLIYHSFNPVVLEKLGEKPNNYPVSEVIFTGSLTTGFGLHQTRIEYLEEIVSRQINLTLYGNLESRNRILMKKIVAGLIRTIEGVGLDSVVNMVPVLKKYRHHAQADIRFYSQKLLSAVQSPVFGMDMFRALARAGVCFNIHGEIAGRCAGNLRLFEATGIGTCLLTDQKSNMAELFSEGEVVTYEGQIDCLEKLEYLLNNRGYAENVAKAGQRRTLKDHTVAIRAGQINDAITVALKSTK